MPVPTFASAKIADGVPVTENDSPFTNPEYAAVPVIVAVVFPLYVLFEIEIPVMVNAAAFTVNVPVT